MKVQNITNVERFFEVVDSCKGKVELVNIMENEDCAQVKNNLCHLFHRQVTYDFERHMKTWLNL